VEDSRHSMNELNRHEEVRVESELEQLNSIMWRALAQFLPTDNLLKIFCHIHRPPKTDSNMVVGETNQTEYESDADQK